MVVDDTPIAVTSTPLAGEAQPEEDEFIDFRLVQMSEVLEMIDAGKILDGKTLISVMLYARKLGLKP